MKISEELFFVFFNCFTCHDKFLCHKYAFDKKKNLLKLYRN